MSGERGDRTITEILEAAAALPPGRRGEYLDANCPDPELRAAVEARLRERDAAGESDLAFEFREPSGVGDSLPPFTMLGEYTILRRLGGGAQASIYLAEQPRLRRRVALKIATGRHTRFDNELIASASLTHPNIVAVYDSGEARGRRYIALEFVDGPTLARDIKDRAARDGDPSTRTRSDDVRRVAEIVASIAEALDYAHRQGRIHRDVKPSNILIGPGGEAKLADFGVAKIVGEGTITEPGFVPGTPHYMSPEQAAALQHRIDGRSDVFSLGSVLYNALALQVPFTGATADDVKQRIISTEPNPVRRLSPEVPRDVEIICRTAMQKDVQERYQTAGQMAADLRAFLAGREIRPPGIRWTRRARKFVVRHRMGVAIVLIVALTALVAAFAARDARRRAAMTCRLAVASTPSGGRVFVARCADDDDVFGPFRLRGTTPLDLDALDPGRYRVVVIADDARFAEADVRLHEPGDAGALAVSLLWTDDVIDGMKLIPRGAYALGADDKDGPYQEPRVRSLPAFFIDACEVTNGDYRRFLEASGEPPPAHWPDLPDDAFHRKPVVSITVDRMEAYARWCGKRLPTVDEWEAACRGAEGRPAPWGDGPPPTWPDVPPERRRRGHLGHDMAAQQRDYDRFVVPACSQPEMSTPEGVHHLAGNVEEMTSSWHLSSGPVVITKGGTWMRHPDDLDLTWSYAQPGTHPSFLIGFRCVRSASSQYVHTATDQESRHARNRIHPSRPGSQRGAAPG